MRRLRPGDPARRNVPLPPQPSFSPGVVRGLIRRGGEAAAGPFLNLGAPAAGAQTRKPVGGPDQLWPERLRREQAGGGVLTGSSPPSGLPFATLGSTAPSPTPPALLTRLSFPPHHQAARGRGGGAPLLGPPNFLITWACKARSPLLGLASLPRPGAVAGRQVSAQAMFC